VVPKVLVVTHPTDVHAVAVVSWLRHWGASVEYLDMSAAEPVAFEPHGAFPTDVAAIWCRRRVLPTDLPGLTRKERGFAISEWRELLWGILSAADVPVINPIKSDIARCQT